MLKWRAHVHIWSCCKLSGGGQNSLSFCDVLSNLIHSFCEGIHAVRVHSGTPRVGSCLCSCHGYCPVCCQVGQLCLLSQLHMRMRQQFT